MFARFLGIFDNSSFWLHLHPVWYDTLHLSSRFVTDSVTAALIRIITSKTCENHPSEAAHPQKHELHNPVPFAKEVVVIFFRNVHRDNNEICIVAVPCFVLLSTLCPGSRSASSYTLPPFGREVALLVWNTWTCGCCCPLCHCPARNTMCCSLSRREGQLLMGL